MPEDIIIRKKRKLLRKIIENTFVYLTWIIILTIVGSLILFLCHINIDNLTTLYLLFSISSGEFNNYLHLATWIVAALCLLGFFVQMHTGMLKEALDEARTSSRNC